MSWTASLQCTPFRKDDAQEAAKLETSVTMSDSTSASGESDCVSFFTKEAVAAFLTDRPLVSSFSPTSADCWPPHDTGHAQVEHRREHRS